ncbi:MAG: hypothetical protein Q9159_004330 [Coniocarpon cinnabarinum]
MGGSGAAKATSQQSKLKFGTKAEAGKEGKASEASEPTQQRPKDEASSAASNSHAETNGDSAMPDIENELAPVKEEPSSSKDLARNSESPARKRQASEKNEDESDEDEAPIRKKRRSALKQVKSDDTEDAPGTNGTTEAVRQKSRKSVKFDEDVEDVSQKPKPKPKEKRQPKKKTSKNQQGAEKTASSEPDESHENADEASAKATASVGSDRDASDHEDDVAPEKKEEVSVKAHEKMQSTLKSKAQDPYPDWKPGDPVPFAALCTTFSKIEMTTKRLEITAHCSLFLRQVMRLTPNDLLPVVLLMVNKLAADYTGIELGIGESLIMKAIGETTGRNMNIIKADQNEIGDLGLVAAKSRSVQPTMFKPKPLTVRGVHEGLIGIATVEGQGAQGQKIAGIKKLLSAADAHLAGTKKIDITVDKGGPSECKYIIRMLEGKMRLGLAEKTVLVALSSAMVTHEISQKGDKVPTTEQLAKGEQVLKSVYNELPSYEVIIPAFLKDGVFNLRDTCNLRPGVPLKPMLARPTKSITEVLDRFEGHDFSCEYKYDGERAQIHFSANDAAEQFATAAPSAGKNEKGVANIFSRNSEDLSKKYPDILQKLPTWVKDGTKSFVLDCETVAWDMNEKKVLPFQQLMTRKRKDVKAEDVKVKVCVFAFDILYLNGEALVNKSFRERREKLHEAFQPVEGEFAFAQHGNTNNIDEIQTLLEASVSASCEGLMVKMLDGQSSYYQPSRRSQNWLKVKKDYLAGVGDSLDLVVLGAYYGKGKRTSVFGAFLLAAYDKDREAFETVCNIGTGFSEAILEELHTQLDEIKIDKPKPFYAHSGGNKDQPDVWFEPKYVWEVKSADLTLSPRYQAAMEIIGQGKGVSLRFPRFLRVREDKKAEEATETKRVAEMYRAQEGVGKSQGPAVDDDFEY